MAIVRTSLAFILLLFHLALFITCKEEEDFDPPNIQWHAPGENENLLALDTILIRASISDNEIISLIRVTLKNSNGIPVLRIPDIRPNTANYSLRVEFPLNEASLSGEHYFEIMAYDETEYNASFRYVMLTPYPREVDHMLFYAEVGTNTEIYSQIDGNMVLLGGNKGDLLKTAVNQDDGQVIHCGRYGGILSSINPVDGLENWKHELNELPQVPNYNDLGFWDEFVLASLEDGRVLAFDPNGIIYYQSVLETGFRPEKVLLHGNKVVYERIDRSSGASNIRVEFFPSSEDNGNAVFPYGRVTAMFTLDWDEILIFSNASDGQYVCTYNTEQHILSQVNYGAYGEFGATVRLDNNTIIMQSGGNILKYAIEENSFATLKSGLSPEVIRFNEAERTLYCLDGDRLHVLDPLDGKTLSVVNLGIDMKSLEFVYNY